jgi:hypothetical protein
MKARLWFLLGLLATTTSWVYTTTVRGPWEHYVNVERGTLRAQMGDLYPSWVGTRELLLRGRNPYGPEVTREIQMAYYGRVISQKYGEPGPPPIDEQRFAYPVYVVLLLAPTTHLSFSQLQEWAPVVLAALTAASVLLWLDVLRWRPPGMAIAAIVLFVLSSPQVVQGLWLRQLGLLVGFLLAAGAWCISRNHLAAAGILLAIATLKPQMAILPLMWFLIWSLAGWPTRRRLLVAFGITLAALAGIGGMILPGWPRYFLSGMFAYRQYSPTISPLALILGARISMVLSGLVIVGLVAWAWRNRPVSAVSGEFIYILASFCTAETLVMPLLTPYNQVLLLLPVLMIIRDWEVMARVWRGVFAVIVIWPWFISLALLLHPPRLDSFRRTPLLPAVAGLLLPFFFALLLATQRNPGKEPGLPSASPL